MVEFPKKRGPFTRVERDTIFVGWSFGADEYGHANLGPVARVSADDTWLVINTDDYEGYAMLRVECLPALIRALSKIRRERRAKVVGPPPPDTGERV